MTQSSANSSTTPGPPQTARRSELRTKEDLDTLLRELTDMSDETSEQASLRADMILVAGQARRRLTLPRAIEVATYLDRARIIAVQPQYLSQAQKLVALAQAFTHRT